MKKNKVRPNLLLAGFQKCGSSSLFDLLNQHPEIVGSTPKETFALCDPDYQNYSEASSWGSRGFQWSAFYPHLDEYSPPKFLLEASVSNFYQKKALKFVHEYPETKVIFILRDPVERFVSTYRYYGGYGVHLKPGTTIEEYYQKSLDKEHGHEAMNYALDHGQYLKYVQVWKKTLGEQNVLVVSLKEAINENDRLLHRVFNFLEIEPMVNLELPHKNESTVNRFPWLNRALVKFFGGSDLATTPLGKFYKKLTLKKPEKINLSDSLERKLRDYYRDEYEEYGHYF